ncbi:MAG: Fic family protein [Spirochaetaceae bacterium]|nr:MAG: Fic family protein [Spirochaetaceae bacterium]
MKARWDAKTTCIYSSLALSHTLLSRGQVAKILANQTRHIPTEYKDVLSYEKALDYIQEVWAASTKPITVLTVRTLAEMVLGQPPEAVERAVNAVEPSIRTLLEYLENQTDHPVIQAGIALCLLSTGAAIPSDSGIVARLTANAFLAKYGYDIRGFLTVEKHWLMNESSYSIALTSLQKQGNLNHWLLFYVSTIEANLQERYEDISNTQVHQDFSAQFWELNERQKGILTHLSDPASSITNRKVQQLFDVSQITASRDLAKLNTLGLIFPHGRGRSITYTRT